MSKSYDVCIACALAEEAKAFIQVLEKQGASFTEGYSAQQGMTYHSTTIKNNKGESLEILVTWMPNMGPMEMGPRLIELTNEFQPRFTGMTGICAGYKGKVSLGDLVVAEKSFQFDAGSFEKDARSGELVHRHEVLTATPNTAILQVARFFEGWKRDAYQLPRPPSKHQQRDWLLNTLYKGKKQIDDLDETELETFAPGWRDIIWELQQGDEPWFDKNFTLIDPTRIRSLIFGPVKFPYKDPAQPACYVHAMAASNAVRKDNPFAEITIPVRSTLALDMESYAFYYTLQQRSSTRSLVVKGVCDYADKEKDDSYHDYAATISAIYMHEFIKEFVNSERMPAPTPTPPAVINSIPSIQSAATQAASAPIATTRNDTPTQPTTGKAPVKIFISSSQAQDDRRMIDSLLTHLTILRNRRKIESWYRHDIQIGDDSKEVVNKQLNEARIILLLITPKYFSSEFYGEEISLIEERYNAGNAIVVPIVLKPIFGWQEEFYGKFQKLPRNLESVEQSRSLDQTMMEIAQDIAALVTKISEQQ